jgi:hypothetical protein
MRKIQNSKILIFIALLFIIYGCSERERSNPLDPENVETGGALTGLTADWQGLSDSSLSGIRLSWDGVSHSDLKGYNVYRKTPSDSEYNLVDTVSEPFYEDAISRQDGFHKYNYAVSVVATSGAESKRSSPVAVEFFVDNFEYYHSWWTWREGSGDAEAINGNLVVNSSGPAPVQYDSVGDSNWTDYIVTSRIKVTSTNSPNGKDAAIGLLFRLQEDRNSKIDSTYALFIFEDGYVAIDYGDNAGWKRIEGISSSINVFAWNDIQIKVNGSQIDCYVNDTFILGATDGRISKGKVGIWVQYAVAHFDYISVFVRQ